MHPLFDTKFGYEDIEGGVKDTDHDSRANDWAITLSQVRNQNAQEKMGGLLLSKLRRFLFAIEKVSKKSITSGGNELTYCTVARSWQRSPDP